MVEYAKERNTQRSHYVWRHYLQSFSFDGDNIHVFDIESQKNEPQLLVNTAVHKRLYLLKGRFTNDDITNFKRLVRPDKNEEFVINELIAFLNSDPIDLPGFPVGDIDTFRKQCDEYIGQKDLGRNQEDLYTFYEENFQELYRKLVKKDAGFYNDYLDDPSMLDGFWSGYWRKLPKFLRTKRYDLRLELLRRLGASTGELTRIRQAIKTQLDEVEKMVISRCIVQSDNYLSIYYFFAFFLTQYFRTLMIEKIHAPLQDFQEEHEPESKADPKKFIALFTHLNLYRLCATLIKDKYRIVFLESDGLTEFITSDQPIINTFGGKEGNMADNELEFYFPLSPKLAMLLTADDEAKGRTEIIIPSQTVERYNALMRRLCHTRLFSHSKLI